MRRFFSLTVGLALAITVGACSRDEKKTELAPQPFCEAVAKLDFDLGYVEPDAQVELIRAVAIEAPTEIKEDADHFLEGMEKVVVKGEPIRSEDERASYEAASERLQRYAIEHCALLKQGGSSPFSGNS